ncbi:MAG TPA: hypothetical protein VKZ58_12570 [Longimicrobiales bacterium]|nr:hypothetical protein [Longimicrobiales bacterium]
MGKRPQRRRRRREPGRAATTRRERPAYPPGSRSPETPRPVAEAGRPDQDLGPYETRYAIQRGYDVERVVVMP